jgi:hypothetical protein
VIHHAVEWRQDAEGYFETKEEAEHCMDVAVGNSDLEIVELVPRGSVEKEQTCQDHKEVIVREVPVQPENEY